MLLGGKDRGQLGRAQPVQVPAEDPVAAAAGHVVQRRYVSALALAQRDDVAEGLPQLHREGVMIDVDVGDEEVPDVTQLVTDLPQPLGESLPGRDQGDAGVDEVDSLVVGDRVDVDRLEPVHRQRERDPVHATTEILDSRLGPGVPVSRGHRSSCH